MEDSQPVFLPKGDQLQSFLRIASISVALYDYLETFPTAWRFYRTQWRSRRLTVSCALFFLLRIFSIVVITLSNIGFFYNKFHKSLCERFFLSPPTFKVLQTMVSQAILSFRVYNLAKRSEKVLYIGVLVYITTCSLQWVSTLVQRQALIDETVHNCRAFSTQEIHFGAWVFYAIAMVYDVLMTSTSAYFLVKYKLTSSSGSVMRKVVNMMLYDGLGYLLVLTAINTANVILYKTSTDIQSAAASLGYCLTWIMSQRLLIHLHDASRSQREESEDAAYKYTYTTDVLSPRGVSDLILTPITTRTKRSRPHSLPYQRQSLHRTSDFDLEREIGQCNREESGVQIRLQQTVNIQRVPQTIQLEDSRRVRIPSGRNIQTRH